MKNVTKYKKIKPTTIGERIRIERTAKGITQDNLANIVSYSREQINYIETDTRQPDINKLVAIANVLDVSTDYLLGRSESKNMDNTTISNRIGLSDKSIEKLSSFMHDSFNIDVLYGDLTNFQDFLFIINKIIENDNFDRLIYYIRKYINSYKIEELKREIKLNKIIDIDDITGRSITYKDWLVDNVEQENYLADFNESSTDICAYKINSLFQSIITSLVEQLESSFAKRWTLNEKKDKILVVCKDGSEKNTFFKDRGIKYIKKSKDTLSDS